VQARLPGCNGTAAKDNPYRNSFDRLSGDFWIADVGQNVREAINLEMQGVTGGRNYGGPAREGAADDPAVPDAAPAGAVDVAG